MQKVDRMPNETYEDYFVRLFDGKAEYGLTCQDIAALLNKEFHQNFDASTYRKEFRAFDRGRAYERKRKAAPVTILALSDFHYPYARPAADFTLYNGLVDVLVLNGDIIDCQSISSFDKVYRLSQMEEIIGGRQYLVDLISVIQPKRVVFTYGNHEIRFQNYLAKNLDSDVLELMPSTPLDLIVTDGFTHYNKKNMTKTQYEPLESMFPNIDIEYNGSWWVQIGKTIFCHPLAYKSGMLKTAEAAVYYFHNQGISFDTVVMAHTHKIGQYKLGNVHLYEQGCCCDVDALHYADGKLQAPQQKGFLLLSQELDGSLIVEKTRIIED